MNLNRRDALRMAGAGVAAMAIDATATTTPPLLATSKNAWHVAAPNLFPASGLYSIAVRPLFKLTRNGKSDIIACHGHLTVKTSKVFVNGEQRRQIDVEVVDWVALGTSSAINGPFEFKFAPKLSGAKSLHSYIVSVSEKDFPAAAQLVVPYEFRTHGASVTGLSIMSGLLRALPPLPADILSMRSLNDGELITTLNSGSEGKDPRIAVEAIACACS